MALEERRGPGRLLTSARLPLRLRDGVSVEVGVPRGAADDDDDDPLVAAARDSVDAVRRAARAAAASDAGRRATAAVSSAASAMRARAGKLSSWLSKNDADPGDY